MSKRKRNLIIRTYTDDDILAAVTKVKNKQISYRKAAKMYGIPHGTLSDKIRGVTPLKRMSAGMMMISRVLCFVKVCYYESRWQTRAYIFCSHIG